MWPDKYRDIAFGDKDDARIIPYVRLFESRQRMGCSTDWYWLLLFTIFVILVGLPFCKQNFGDCQSLISWGQEGAGSTLDLLSFHSFSFFLSLFFPPISGWLKSTLPSCRWVCCNSSSFSFFFCSIFCHAIAAFYFHVHYLSCVRF